MMQDGSNWPAGIKRTRQRELVWEVLEEKKGPITASDIFHVLENEGHEVWLSTIYRVLDTFVREKMVIKSSIANTDMAYYEKNRQQHKHYAICTACHRIIPMKNCPMEAFKPQLEEDFTITGHHIEIFGLCHQCKEDAEGGEKRDADHTDS